MGMLAEQLRSIIEGPLGTETVTVEEVTERVGAIQQNERRHVFGTVVYRDGEDGYYIDDMAVALTRREAVGAIKEELKAVGRLDEIALGAMLAMGDQQKDVDAAEKKIGETFKGVAKRYVDALNSMTGAKWKVVSASDSIFSLDSNESPKRAIDIYWEYDPGSKTATIYVEGPKGKQTAFARQRLSSIKQRNYIDWLSSVLKEEMDLFLAAALTEDEPVTEEVNRGRGSLIEEIQGIIDEAAVVAYRRRVAKAPPMHVRGPSKPKSVPSGTAVGRLFKQLVKALTHGGDWDTAIKALRKEGVPEKHINYAIKHKEVPYVYAEGVEGDVIHA
jgi:hypothetical protein